MTAVSTTPGDRDRSRRYSEALPEDPPGCGTGHPNRGRPGALGRNEILIEVFDHVSGHIRGDGPDPDHGRRHRSHSTSVLPFPPGNADALSVALLGRRSW